MNQSPVGKSSLFYHFSSSAGINFEFSPYVSGSWDRHIRFNPQFSSLVSRITLPLFRSSLTIPARISNLNPIYSLQLQNFKTLIDHAPSIFPSPRDSVRSSGYTCHNYLDRHFSFSTITMLPSIRQPRWLRTMRLSDQFRYSRLPLTISDVESKGSGLVNINIKGIRWRSPSPGGERFPIRLRMSFFRLLFIAITALLCFGLMIVALCRRHRNTRVAITDESQLPWQAYPKYEPIFDMEYR
jgi:hypothetical protein